MKIKSSSAVNLPLALTNVYCATSANHFSRKTDGTFENISGLTTSQITCAGYTSSGSSEIWAMITGRKN